MLGCFNYRLIFFKKYDKISLYFIVCGEKGKKFVQLYCTKGQARVTKLSRLLEEFSNVSQISMRPIHVQS